MKDILFEVRLPLDKVQIVHIIAWTSFIFLEVVVAGALRQHYSSLAYYVLFYMLNITLFYLHGKVVMPFSRQRGILGVSKFVVLLLLEIIAYLIGAILTGVILTAIFHETTTSPFPLNIRYVAVVTYRAIFFMAFGTGYYFLIHYLQRKQSEMQHAVEVEKLENQLLTTQKDYLRAQINPHLLFNTLDFIKAVSKKNPEQSDEAIDCLSEIMDYAIQTSYQDLVNIEGEVAQIEHMIRLNLLRSNSRVNLNFIKKIDYSAQIIPIILLTLVENVFKHGNLLDKNNDASIELYSSRKAIIFRTSNLIGSTPPSKSGRTGLKNIAARLNATYPNNHLFTFGTKSNIFWTDLRINISPSSS